MDTDPVNNMVQRLIRGGMVETPEEIHGCTESEIAALERLHNTRLPDVYRRFLARMGRGAGGIGNGEYLLYDDVVNQEDTGVTRGEDYDPFIPPKRAFWFHINPGTFAAYFEVNGEDDPFVYIHNEGTDHWEETGQRLSHYLLILMEMYVSARKRLNELYASMEKQDVFKRVSWVQKTYRRLMRR